MYVVIYQFHVKSDHYIAFQQAWNALTLLFRKHAHSLGSRLHKENEGQYIAYAQWPDKVTWENAKDSLPKEAEKHRQSMKAACIEIKTLHQLTVVDDLLLHLPS